ncbi:MAG TPA: acyl-CoA dehydrogenase family protein [Candidatus Limnocylindria bacterium]|nr:acyl-CoA dehydrogenase family protein [Candidatus Limnocylindria bacterium]
MNFFLDDAALVATFDRGIPWERVVRLTEGPAADVAETVAAWREVLSVAGRFIGTEIAACAREVDALGVVQEDGQVGMNAPLKRNLRGLADLGLMGLSLPREHGGSGLPFTVTVFVIAMLARACPSTMVQYAFYTAPAAMIFRSGTDEQRRRYLPRLARGEIMGAVAMTEPQAGSDIGAIATTATERDGGWVVEGRKQFISAGNGDFVILLARCIPGSHGLDGLGLFLADRAADNYVVERAEHKFTIRGSPTCALRFEGTRAELLGTVGEGWHEILSFMNESRVGVGIQGLGIGTAAFAAAAAYAKQRIQMGRPIREHPLVAEMLVDMETSLAGVRALITEAAVLQDEVLFARDEGSARRLRELTPLVKWYGAEEMIRVCRQALQIHGGYGVVTEYEVERHMRDSLILPIYEGTSQIQSLMAVRDLMRALLRDPASLLRGGPSPTLARARFAGPTGRSFAAARGALVATLRGLTAGLVRRRGLALVRGRRAPTDDEIGPFLLHAERITETLAHLHAARALAEQARRIPEHAALASRAAARARSVAERNARAVRAGDGGVFARIRAWEQER